MNPFLWGVQDVGAKLMPSAPSRVFSYAEAEATRLKTWFGDSLSGVVFVAFRLDLLKKVVA
ncbi:MAG: hypothetical protein H6Q33_1448 [Deltaproteobacteria bacterium]|nr:hypothetical protein [Deltaproteobacteria bacterium]